jgi:pyruvate ferredoxin oxidoreductase gamma subunit
MLGALVKITGTVKIESLEAPIKERFGRIAAKNMAAAKSAYDQVKFIN